MKFEEVINHIDSLDVFEKAKLWNEYNISHVLRWRDHISYENHPIKTVRKEEVTEFRNVSFVSHTWYTGLIFRFIFNSSNDRLSTYLHHCYSSYKKTPFWYKNKVITISGVPFKRTIEHTTIDERREFVFFKDDKAIPFEDWIDPSKNIKVTDHGENWQQNGYAQRIRTDYFGIYDYYIKWILK